MKKHVFFDGESFSIWSLDYYKYVRETYHVVGELTMSSPWHPQQSVQLCLPVIISKYDAMYLASNGGGIIVKPKFKRDYNPEFTERAKIQNLYDPESYEPETIQMQFEEDDLYRIYRDLMSRGFYVCDGSMYAADFCVYKQDPALCHSFALIFHPGQTRDIIAESRVSQSVLKAQIYAYIDSNSSIRYIKLKRIQDPDNNSLFNH